MKNNSLMLRIGLSTILCHLAILGFAQNNIGPGNAVEFNGSGDFIDAGQAIPNLTLPVTVSTWLLPNSTSSVNLVFASNTGPSNEYYGLSMQTRNSQIAIRLGGGSGGFSSAGRSSYSVTIPGNFFGEWIHVTAIYRGIGDMDIYVNGILMNGSYAGSATSYDDSYNGNFWIGKADIDNIHYFDGKIDNFAVWDRELTVAEIRVQMCSKIDASDPDLLLAYDFNESAGSTSFNNMGTVPQNAIRSGASTMPSSAPIGDESTEQYAVSTFNNQTVNLSLSSQTFFISLLDDPAQGVHLYKINNDPSIVSSNCLSPDAWGVFVADVDFARNDQWNVSGNPAEIEESRLNITDLWQISQGPLSNLVYQSEFIIGEALEVPFSDTTVCDSIFFAVPQGTTAQWTDGVTGSRYLIAGTSYQVTLSNNSCTSIEQIIVRRSQAPVLNYQPLYTICEDEVLDFVVPSDFTTVSWRDGYMGNQRTITEPGIYEFTAIYPCGSIDGEFEVQVIICEDVYIYLPNVFTPNGDGLNDIYFIENLNGLNFTWIVFNRWGAEIFSTSDENTGWDGTYQGRPVAEGAYPIILKYRSRTGELTQKSGFISVLR